MRRRCRTRLLVHRLRDADASGGQPHAAERNAEGRRAADGRSDRHRLRHHHPPPCGGRCGPDQVRSHHRTFRRQPDAGAAGHFAQPRHPAAKQRPRRQPAQHQHPRYRYDEQQRTADRHRRSGVGQRQLQQAQSLGHRERLGAEGCRYGRHLRFARRQRRAAGHHQEGQAESGSDRRTHGHGRLAAARSALHARSGLAECYAAQHFQSQFGAGSRLYRRTDPRPQGARQRHVLHGRDSADGHAAELQRQRIGRRRQYDLYDFGRLLRSGEQLRRSRLRPPALQFPYEHPNTNA